MKFAYTILYVTDVTAATKFYESCFGLKTRFIHESGQYAELETEGVTLAFTSEDLARQNLGDTFELSKKGAKALGLEIALVDEDVAKAFKHAIANGAEAVLEPVEKPWGQTVAYVKDLNGFLIELASPMGA